MPSKTPLPITYISSGSSRTAACAAGTHNSTAGKKQGRNSIRYEQSQTGNTVVEETRQALLLVYALLLRMHCLEGSDQQPMGQVKPTYQSYAKTIENV
jgi:hypothetical protein